MFAKNTQFMSELLINIENLSISRNAAPIITDFSLSVKQGEFYYLRGKVGSGKSTFLKTLYADIPVQSGKVEVLGYNLCTITREELPLLRRKLGLVFQDYKLLFDRTVFENLKFVGEAAGMKNSKRIKTRINICLEMVKLADKSNKMPYELSGGEQQLIAIARAMINDPKLILADEPTGNLDIETSEQILHLLNNFVTEGKSVLMATHQNYQSVFPAKEILF